MDSKEKLDDTPTSSTLDIMNVKTLIETAFGDADENRVNFKLIQTILFLLARQLRILDRRVAYEGPFTHALENIRGIKVTEVKVHAMQPKSKKGKKDGDKLKLPNQESLEKYIDRTEKVLRIINQRADSREEPDTKPKAMAGPEPLQPQHEKLLVVERVSSREGSSSKIGEAPRLSVVTQEEFMKLARTVRSLQAHFGQIGSGIFPENSQLMESLRQDASLTDAMAALQLSARLEAVEKILGRMTQLLTTVIVATPGITVDSETRVFLQDHAATDLPDLSQVDASAGIDDTKVLMEAYKEDGHESDAESVEGEFVTNKQFKLKLKSFYDQVMHDVHEATDQTTSNANIALKLATTLDTKLTAALNLGPKMTNLENSVSNYVEQINSIDTSLSAQMSNYQEQLTQMQHELEIGLDAMAEAMANTGGDTAAMAELNTNFASLQTDFESMMFRQKRVFDGLDTVKSNLASLWKQIEMLRDSKSDREEVADALRDKAGIRDLNGLVPLEQFDAVRGDFEKKIQDAYNKFNNQEIIWQKAIDEILRDLSDKGDLNQLESLTESMHRHLEILRTRMEFIASIVGEPKTAIATKRLFRDSACICCSTPASMDMVHPTMVPELPKLHGEKQSEGIDSKKQIRGDGDTRPCYPGLPILHPIDPRAHYCQRYCGGSHTKIPSGPPKIPPSFVIKPVRTDDHTEIGTDGKVYKVDEKIDKRDTQDPPPPPSPLG